MASLAEVIRLHHAEILSSWTREAQQTAAARGLSGPEFRNIIPEYLRGLAEAGDELGLFTGKRREHVESHLSSRLRQGFQLAQIIEEFALLGRCIAATWNSRASEPPERGEVEQLFEELNLTSVAVTESFVRHMMEDEQAEKQYLRLIQTVAFEALQPDTPDLRARLEDVLELVMEAMAAQSIVLLLYNAANEQLEVAGSVGVAAAELERHVSSLAPAWFAGQLGEGENATSALDTTTELQVCEALRRSGINSLLGVRLPLRHGPVGVMYAGLQLQGAFTPREIRRLESLGQQLTLHLDNAKLYRDMRQHIERLDSERELRERFVAVLAHDLRGPLSAARVSAQVLMQRPERLDERRDLARKIERNIERTDQMIRDLLDANRIRAGERLPLRIEEADLVAVAREVLTELAATFGPRFVLDAQRAVVGFWSSEELRRALWNLATNAVKYGAADTPISIGVKAAGASVLVSVHNRGEPISPDDQKRLFRLYSRTHAAQTSGKKGWGLGLTLVHGCAVAHGGRVEVTSSRESGTTFTLNLPLDARSFQPDVH